MRAGPQRRARRLIIRSTSVRCIALSVRLRLRPRLRKSGPPSVVGDPGRLEIRVHVFLRAVMGWHVVPLAALLVQTEPPALARRVVVLNAHADRRADAGEGVDHDGRSGRGREGRRWNRCRWSRVASRASSAVSAGVLPRLHDVFRPAHRGRRVHRHTWPITSQSNSIRIAARCCFTVGAARLRCNCSIYVATTTGSTSRAGCHVCRSQAQKPPTARA